MKKVLISPSKYVQDNGALADLGEYVLAYGKTALLVASDEDRARVQDNLDEAVKKNDFELVYGGFGGECTKEEVERLIAVCKEKTVKLLSAWAAVRLWTLPRRYPAQKRSPSSRYRPSLQPMHHAVPSLLSTTTKVNFKSTDSIEAILISYWLIRASSRKRLPAS